MALGEIQGLCAFERREARHEKWLKTYHIRGTKRMAQEKSRRLDGYEGREIWQEMAMWRMATIAQWAKSWDQTYLRESTSQLRRNRLLDGS